MTVGKRGVLRGVMLLAMVAVVSAGRAQDAQAGTIAAKAQQKGSATAGDSDAAKAEAKTGAWVVRQPYKDNPLKEAVLAGGAEREGWKGKAELQLNCRPGNDLVYVEMHLNATGSGFDVDPFEGPGGAGEKSKGMKVAVGAQSWTRSFSGFYLEGDTFVFSSAMPGDEALAVVADAGGGQTLAVEIAPADGKGAALTGTFVLPHEAKAVRAAVGPCMEGKAKGKD
jgi:hypothetical protein